MSQTRDNDSPLMAEVLEKIPSAIIVIDAAGIIVKANDMALALLGESSLEGRRWVEVIGIVFRPRSDDGHEISTRDGRRLQVQTVPLSSGQLIQMTDLTETRLLQDKVSHMERLSSLGRMAASLAHQIRTPLSAAILYAANLGNANLQPAARTRFQEKLMSRLEALEAQVSDILMFARSNEQTVSEIDTESLVEQAANNVTAVLQKGGASLDTQIEAEGLSILGNATALTGALSNLIANAVEAGAKNVIINLAKEGDRVVFSVANDGPIIPEELRTKIFEPFYTSKSSGTGLGLAVVSAVTKVHQGILNLTSWDNTFATVFEISIPICTPEQAAALKAKAENEANAASATATLEAKGKSGVEPLKTPRGPSETAIGGGGSMGDAALLNRTEDELSDLGNSLSSNERYQSSNFEEHNSYGKASVSLDPSNLAHEQFAPQGAFHDSQDSSLNDRHLMGSDVAQEINAMKQSSTAIGTGTIGGSSLGSLPKTAEGISKQAAVAANTATSEAFAAYARKHQQAKSEDAPAMGYTQVEVNVSSKHKLIDAAKDKNAPDEEAVGAANAVFASVVRQH